MKRYTIVVCRGCGKKFKIYPFQVYDGDPEYCKDCNREAKDFTGEVVSEALKKVVNSCPKCGGKVTPEKIHSSQGAFDGWKCIMCGDVFDELVLEHRKLQRRESYAIQE